MITIAKYVEKTSTAFIRTGIIKNFKKWKVCVDVYLVFLIFMINFGKLDQFNSVPETTCCSVHIDNVSSKNIGENHKTNEMVQKNYSMFLG